MMAWGRVLEKEHGAETSDTTPRHSLVFGVIIPGVWCRIPTACASSPRYNSTPESTHKGWKRKKKPKSGFTTWLSKCSMPSNPFHSRTAFPSSAVHIGKSIHNFIISSLGYLVRTHSTSMQLTDQSNPAPHPPRPSTTQSCCHSYTARQSSH
jgi:hypothetical protein